MNILKEIAVKKKLLIIPAVVAVLALGWAVAGSRAMADSQNENQSIVGAWEVDAAAPYRPHLFTFHADGTMTSTNPTNVQESPDRPHGGTNDSLGMGSWRLEKQGEARYVVGTFWELNALADSHQPTDTLKVSFKVQLTNDGAGFDGPAVVHIGTDVIPSHLTGTQRIVVDQDAVGSL